MNGAARGGGAKVLIVFSILALPSSALAQSADTARQRCHAVNTPHEARVAACTQVIDSGARSADERARAYADRANGYRRQFIMDRAAQDFAAALKLNPNHFYARLSRAQFFEQSGKKDEARAEYEWITGRPASAAQDLVSRGQAHYHLERWDSAIADFSKAIALSPNEAEAYYLRAGAYQRKGGLRKEEFNDLTKAIDLKFPLAAVYIQRGYLYGSNGQHEASIEDFTQAIALQPNEGFAHAGRCQSQTALDRNLDRALQDCNKAVSLIREFFLEDRGMVLLKLGRFAEAESDFDGAVKFDNSATAYFGRGIARLRLGRKAEAAEDMARARKEMPWVDQAFERYGVKP